MVRDRHWRNPDLFEWPVAELDDSGDPRDPEIIEYVVFQSYPPTVADVVGALTFMPQHLPIYVNGEGMVSGIEVIDPTNAQPFKHIVTEIHVVIG